MMVRLKDFLGCLDHEVWALVRPPQSEDIALWSADWHCGCEPGSIRVRANRPVGEVYVETHPSPETGEPVNMIVIETM